MKTIIIVVIIAVIIVIAAGLSMSIEEPVEAKPWAGLDCTEMLDFSATSDHNLMDDIMHIEFHEHYMNSC